MALAEHLKPDTAVILGTSGSQWSVLVEHLAKGEEVEEARLQLYEAETRSTITQPMLNAVAPIMRRAVGTVVTPRVIPFGKDADEQYRVLDVIADAVPIGEVSFDLTHGFRHLGMVGFMSALLECARRGLRVDDYETGRKPAIDRLSEEMHAGEHSESKKAAFLLLRDIRNTLAHGGPARRQDSRAVLRDPDRLYAEMGKTLRRLLQQVSERTATPVRPGKGDIPT